MNRNSLFVIQPSFLPWYGQFSMILKSNTLIFLDDVQYDSNGWRNRNRVKILNSTEWITVPILSKGRFGQQISEVEIDNRQNWRRDIINKLHHGYCKQPFYEEIFQRISDEIKAEETKLLNLNVRLLKLIFDILGNKIDFTFSSEMNDISIDPNQRLIDLCFKTNCKQYNSGQSAKSYLKNDIFEQNAIFVKWFQEGSSEEISEIYPLYSERLTILDLLFRLGSRESTSFLYRYGSWE